MATAVALALPVGAVAAQAPDSTGWHLRPSGDTLTRHVIPELRPGGRLGPRVTPFQVGLEFERATLAAIAANRQARRRSATLALLIRADSDTTVAAAEPPVQAVTPPPPVSPFGPTYSALGKYADLSLDLRATFTMKFDQLRNLHCTPADLENPFAGCRGGFPTPALDQQFDVRAGGVVSDRIHVNVDYDSKREFTATNNISLWYDGLEDEIIKRVDLGNVNLQLPPSRLISASLPANSFGIQALGQFAGLEFRAVAAQQKGSTLANRTFTVGQTTSQPADFQINDRDFESGRFFFVVDPRVLPNYPLIDVLNISRETLAPTQRVNQVRVYRLRAQSGQAGSSANLGGIQAVARRSDSPQRVGPFNWDLLVEGRDYYLDPSVTWFALSGRVTNDDYLAVSYITAAGDTVGTFPGVNGVSGTRDSLQLIYEPRRGPEVPTFFQELRNVYRLGGSDVNRTSLTVIVKLNDAERPLDGNGTYLARLGLAQQTNQSVVDQYNRVFPRARDPNGGLPIHDIFLIFPALRPFADSTRLEPAERSDSLYRIPTYLMSSQGPPPRFRLQLHYDATGVGDRSRITLGSFAVRQGSEKLLIGGRQLTRDVDYKIDYLTGEVVFTNPDSLFTGTSQVTAQFEENLSFDAAPKSVLGLSTTYTVGSVGHINIVGLLQREQSLFNRPQIGFEPRSTFLGGMSGDLQFRSDGLTTLLNRLPLIETSVPSTITLTGEVAMSRPNPNSAGQAFIEEFESSASTSLNLFETAYQYGSRPFSGRGLSPTLLGASGGFDITRAVMLNWQNLVATAKGPLEFHPADIDSSIVLVGTTTATESVLWLTLQPDTVGGLPDITSPVLASRWRLPHTPGPRWRSITQTLDRSGLGVDFSTKEYLEFWVLEDADRRGRQDGAMLVLDFGTVFEDAVAIAPESLTVNGKDTVYTGRQFVGVGRLDSEKDTLTNVFNASRGDNGISADVVPSIVNTTTGETLHDLPVCDFTQFPPPRVFPLGYVGSQCTRHNGLGDTEDLNGDNRLDITVGAAEEDVFRYVLPIGGDKYFVRNGSTLGTPSGGTVTWRLYRIPFRSDTIQVGAPSVRRIRSLRLTLVAPDRGGPGDQFSIAVARMQLVGAPWLKRSATPIAGLSGSQGQPHGEVVASVVTTENADLGYTSPPGVSNQAAQVGSVLQAVSQQINERSLRLLATDLRLGERAEAFKQFTDEADKNFLNYRQLRVWARGRGPGWEDHDLDFYIKVGRDVNNFYLYRVPARSVSWQPEVVVELPRWLLLRAKVEAAYLAGTPPSGAAQCGGDSTAYVACDGPYLVQMRDPGIAPPNLARVTEVAVGMVRVQQNAFLGQAELWVDDIRLSDVVSDVGIASIVDARITAADVADLAVSYTRRDALFRQLNENPSYNTTAGAQVGSTFHLDKLFPAAWGLAVPISVQYAQSASDPLYLNQSDVLADAIAGLRRPASSATSYQVSLRRVRRGTTVLEHTFVDPWSLSAGRQTSDQVSELSTAQATSEQYTVAYAQVPGAVEVKAAPGFLVSLIDQLPHFIRESAFGRAVKTARLRLNPTQFNFNSVLTDTRTTRFAYRVPIALDQDAAAIPQQSATHTWRNNASLDLRPFNSLSAQVAYTSTRDLRPYGDSTTMGRLLGSDRQSLGGVDIGFEQQRVFSTSVSVQPVINHWWTPRLSFTSSFSLNRDPNNPTPVREGVDSTGAFRVPAAFTNSRSRDLGSQVSLQNLSGAVFGDSNFVAKVFSRFEPADLSYTTDQRSSFDRARFDPSLRYQLALGGIDEFRAQAGDLATSTSLSQTWGASVGASLPLGLRARFNYRDQSIDTWAKRGADQVEIIQRSTEWPSGSAGWVYSPRFAGLEHVLSSISTQARYQRQRTSSLQPTIGTVPGADIDTSSGVRTQTVTTIVSPAVTLTWANGMSTAAQYSESRTDATTAGNITRSDQTTWGGSVNFTFKRPGSGGVDVRSTVTFNVSDLSTCLIRTGSEDCTSVSDSKRQLLDVRMDSPFSRAVTGGLSFSYVLSEQLATSAKLAQVTFTIFGSIIFSAGRGR